MMDELSSLQDPYVDLWCHLQSMHTAVEHYIERTPTAFDQERLAALAAFVKASMEAHEDRDDSPSADSLQSGDISEFHDAPRIDVIAAIDGSEAFNRWRHEWKRGRETRINDLATFAESLASQPTQKAIRRQNSAILRVLRGMLEELISQTESAMLE